MVNGASLGIAGFDMGYATVAGQAPVNTIKFSLDDGSTCLVVLPRKTAVKLIDELFALAEARLVGQQDAAGFQRALERAEQDVVRTRPTMTADEANDPPLSSYVRSFTLRQQGDSVQIDLVFANEHRRLLTIDIWRSLVLVSYTNNVMEVADVGLGEALSNAHH